MNKTAVTVVKIGGKVLDDDQLLAGVLDSFAAIEGPKILVHGGGKAATEIAGKLGVEAPMINGRRITNDAMMDVALMVYGGLMNRKMAAGLQARGINALGLTGADLNVIQAHKRPVKDIDYGLAGDIDAVDGKRLLWLLEGGITPIMAPLTHDGKGQMLNTNADTIASSTARSLAREATVSLVFTFEKPGVMTDPDDDTTVIPHLDRQVFEYHREAGNIAGGMIPKLTNAFEALSAGVDKVYICHANALADLQRDSFVGTIIS